MKSAQHIFAYFGKTGAFVNEVKTDRDRFTNEILRHCEEVTGHSVHEEEKFSIRNELPHLATAFSKANPNLGVVIQYRLPLSSERINAVVIGKSAGKPQAIVVELKGWNSKVVANEDHTVSSGKNVYQSPVFQVKNYVGKLQFSHSCSSEFQIRGATWLYNLNKGSVDIEKADSSVPVFWRDEHSRFSEWVNENLNEHLEDSDERKFIEGQYVQNMRLFDKIRENFTSLRKGTWDALCATGFGPYERQHVLMSSILGCVTDGRRKVFLIKGEPGSGKSYLAVILLLNALKNAPQGYMIKENVAVLGYRNNRLINTVRTVFENCEKGLSAPIKFYSDKYGRGIAQGSPDDPHFRLAVFDEAQRMTKDNIRIAMQRADVVVFFYDPSQILNADEQGWDTTFDENASSLNVECEHLKLEGVYRVSGGQKYHEFVESLITAPGKTDRIAFAGYDMRFFGKITDMLSALREKSKDENSRVALIAAFTESPGDSKNMTAKNLKNLRVGFKLYSNFKHYEKNTPQIYWLMEPTKQYPAFWAGGKSNDLSYCASIYGCQGFEADYVGLIWGRDFVLRNGAWQVGDNCEDNIGKPSLASLFARAKAGSIDTRNSMTKLLENRYRIFLTRGINGTYIYCEDASTAAYLERLFAARK